MLFFHPALDADLRFALETRPDNNIVGRCLVYVHKVVNAKGERQKGQMDSELQPQSEVRAFIHLLYHNALHFHSVPIHWAHTV